VLRRVVSRYLCSSSPELETLVDTTGTTPPPFVIEVLDIFLTFFIDDMATTYLRSGRNETDLSSPALDKQHLAFAHGGPT